MVADFDKKVKVGGVIFLIIIFLLIIADFKIYQKKQELISQIETYKKQIEDIKKSSQTLKEEIANSNNPDYLEKLAYEQLGEQKPGEKEVIFVMPEEKPKQDATPRSFWSNFSGWISGAWQWIKNRF